MLTKQCLVYQIKPGRTVAGSLDAGAHIKLSGSHILAEHCIFDNVNGRVTLEAIQDSLTMVRFELRRVSHVTGEWQEDPCQECTSLFL